MLSICSPCSTLCVNMSGLFSLPSSWSGDRERTKGKSDCAAIIAANAVLPQPCAPSSKVVSKGVRLEVATYIAEHGQNCISLKTAASQIDFFAHVKHNHTDCLLNPFTIRIRHGKGETTE